MSQVIIENKKPCFRTLQCPTDKDQLRSIVLDPGANIVEEEILVSAKKVEHQRILFAKGFMTHREVPKAVKEFDPQEMIADLSELKIVEALKAVAACDNPKQLLDWAQQDGRKRIKEALLKRSDELAGETPGAEVEETEED